jgi:hypothetical protein
MKKTVQIVTIPLSKKGWSKCDIINDGKFTSIGIYSSEGFGNWQAQQLLVLLSDAEIGDYIPIGFPITEEKLKESGWKYIEVSPFTGKPEWVYGEYINPELDLPGTKFVLITEDDNIIISYYGETIYKRKVTSMKEISEFVKFFK